MKIGGIQKLKHFLLNPLVSSSIFLWLQGKVIYVSGLQISAIANPFYAFGNAGFAFVTAGLALLFVFSVFYREDSKERKFWAVVCGGAFAVCSMMGAAHFSFSAIAAAVIEFISFSYLSLSWSLVRPGGAKKKDVLRGTEIVTSVETEIADDQSQLIQIGGRSIGASAETQGILIMGATGSGKSVALRKVARTLRRRGNKAIVYDPTGEMIGGFYRAGQDVILNPLDKRDCRWNPGRDLNDPAEVDAFATSVIPSSGGQNDFFNQSARQLLSGLIQMYEYNVIRAVETLVSQPVDDLFADMESCGLAGLMGDEKSFSSVRSTAIAYARALTLLHPPEDGEGFSIREWVAEPGDSWLFVPSTASTIEITRPLISAALEIAVKSIMDLPPDAARRIGVFLDELPAMQRLPALNPLLTQARKYGVVPVIAFQSVGQVYDRYQKDEGSALLGQPATRILLRASDAETAEWASRDIGDHQIRREVKSQSNSESYAHPWAAGPGSNSKSTSEQYSIERAVMPSEFQALPDLSGFARFKGAGVTEIKMRYESLDEIAPQRQPVKSRSLIARRLDGTTQRPENPTETPTED